MTPEEIVHRLHRLSDNCEDIAIALDYYGGFAPWSKYSQELLGASVIIKNWIYEIEDDS